MGLRQELWNEGDKGSGEWRVMSGEKRGPARGGRFQRFARSGNHARVLRTAQNEAEGRLMRTGRNACATAGMQDDYPRIEERSFARRRAQDDHPYRMVA